MPRRTLIAGFGLVLVLAVLVWQLARLLENPAVWPPDDFVEYWAAGRLALEGRNPYSPELLLPLEREAGRDTDEAVMMWNPPWTLPVVMPVGALPPRFAQLSWLFLHLVLLGVSVTAVWSVYRGPPRFRWISWMIGATFLPTLLVLNTGQIGPLLVAGAALFLWAAKANRPMLAGAATVLIAIKPHLAYLLWVAIFTDAAFNRRWKMLLGGFITGLVFAVIPLAFDPNVYAEYSAAMREHKPAQWVSLTLGTLLRSAFGERHFWLQFLPLFLGFGWFALRWNKHARHWNWIEQFPLLMLVSFVTSPYGAWHFDLVLLLIPILHRGAQFADLGWNRNARFTLVFLIVVNLAMFGINLSGAWSFYYAWVAPMLLAGYLFFRGKPA